MANPYVKDVSEAQFMTEVVDRSTQVPVLVDFWAEWCGPCKTLSPLLEAAAAEYAGAFELVKIDVDANQALSQQMKVQGIPTVVAFVGGQPVGQFSGAVSEAELRAFIEQFVGPTTDPEVDAALDLLDTGDVAGAEAALRSILTVRASEDAAKTLAMIYIDTDRMREALEVLSTLTPDDETKRLIAMANMSTAAANLDSYATAFSEDPNIENRVSYAKALAGAGQAEIGFDVLLDAVAERDDDSDPARLAMIEIFEMLGSEDPLVGVYRKRLANALY
ncbi:MAG: thioredoxin [Acidimicrobiia bacterium]|nr:thioredoxin [Acidimicrobiia bacterium]